MRGRDEKSISDNFLYMLKAKLFKTRHFFAFARDIMSLRPVICYLWKIKNKKWKREREREREREKEKRESSYFLYPSLYGVSVGQND